MSYNLISDSQFFLTKWRSVAACEVAEKPCNCGSHRSILLFSSENEKPIFDLCPLSYFLLCQKLKYLLKEPVPEFIERSPFEFAARFVLPGKEKEVPFEYIETYCASCGKGLCNTSEVLLYPDGAVIQVEPCSNCLEKEYEMGFRLGLLSGFKENPPLGEGDEPPRHEQDEWLAPPRSERDELPRSERDELPRGEWDEPPRHEPPRHERDEWLAPPRHERDEWLATGRDELPRGERDEPLVSRKLDPRIVPDSDFEVFCAKCGSKLFSFSEEIEYMDGIALRVEPCPSCLSSIRKKSFSKGLMRGGMIPFRAERFRGKDAR